MRRIRQKTVFAVLFVAAGFLAGTMVPEVFRMTDGDYTGLLSLYSLQKYENLVWQPQRVFFYVLSIRVRTLLFLWMSCYAPAGYLFHLLYAWWLSMSAGMMLSLFVLRKGYEGILLFCACLFPQWLLYAEMWRRELSFLLRLSSGSVAYGRIEAGSSDREEQPRSGEVSYGPLLVAETEFRKQRPLSELCKMMILCALGCVLEALLGGWTLQIFLQIF